MDGLRIEDEIGVSYSWGAGREVIFLSNPLADPVSWSSSLREDLLGMGYRVTTFEHRPQHWHWQSVIECVDEFVARRTDPVALVGWSQGACIAQETALVAGERVCCAVLLAPYGRQSEIDKTLQQAWDRLAREDRDMDSVRLALGFLSAFPPERLTDDGFVRLMRSAQHDWAGIPAAEARERSANFISTYQDRLPALAELMAPCLVMGFQLDTDTFAARAREVARAIRNADYVELSGLAHAAPISDPERVGPLVVAFLARHYSPW